MHSGLDLFLKCSGKEGVASMVKSVEDEDEDPATGGEDKGGEDKGEVA